MKKEEFELENECRLFARSQGIVCWKNEKNGNKGIPDDSFLLPNGIIFLVEFKKNDKQKLRPEQKMWLEKYPYTCFLISSFDEFCNLIEYLCNTTRCVKSTLKND